MKASFIALFVSVSLVAMAMALDVVAPMTLFAIYFHHYYNLNKDG
jgi:hypothetical protein